jgi:hypothetical protein
MTTDIGSHFDLIKQQDSDPSRLSPHRDSLGYDETVEAKSSGSLCRDDLISSLQGG